MQNLELGMDRDKICGDSTTKNNANTPQLIRPICPNQPKHLGYFQKKALLGVRSPC